jgi:hypothetical protein
MMCFLQRFYDERLAEDSSFAWNGWLQAIALLGLRPLVPLAEAAFQEGRIGPNLTDRSYFEADLARAEREPDDPGRFKDDNLDYIDDVLGALQRVYRLGEPSGELGPPPPEPKLAAAGHLGRVEQGPGDHRPREDLESAKWIRTLAPLRG